ncbi:MAG: glycoside hydrolase family 3 N-terminal domain-containing protein [Micropruina glycogenica]
MWPDTLGLAATRDEALVERFGDIARQEYTAVGIRVALHPQIDLATEPRWSRQLQTFGEDVEAHLRPQRRLHSRFSGHHAGPRLGRHHDQAFSRWRPAARRRRPALRPRREQVYPGGRFELHLKPFEAAFEAGTSQIMPYYGMPVGTDLEEVGFGFNKGVITTMLRERFGFDGIVCTDWGLINDSEIMGAPFPARAWGWSTSPSRAHDQGAGRRCRPVRRRGLPRAVDRHRARR